MHPPDAITSTQWMHSEQIYKAKSLEIEPRTEFDLARTVHVAQTLMPEVSGPNIPIRVSPVRMIEHVQEFTLEDKVNAFGNWKQLRHRHVVVPKVRTVEPRVAGERARDCVLTCACEERSAIGRRRNTVYSLQKRRVEAPLERTRIATAGAAGGSKHTCCLLQLRSGHTAEEHTRVAVIVNAAESTRDLEWEAGLVRKDVPYRPTT